MAKWYQQALNIFFPITCIGCGRDLPSDDYFRICPDCLGRLELIKGFSCEKCGKVLPDGGEHCFICRKKSVYSFDMLRSAGEYKGLLKELIHKFKYQNKNYFDRIFSRLIKYVLDKEKIYSNVDYVIPVPMHWLKEFRRGYNQACLLAEKTALYLNKPLLKNILIRKRITKPQFSLNREERAKNLKNSFEILNSGILKGKKVLLVDDIATTCATIEQCSIVLKASGASKVYAVTIARD